MVGPATATGHAGDPPNQCMMKQKKKTAHGFKHAARRESNLVAPTLPNNRHGLPQRSSPLAHRWAHQQRGSHGPYSRPGRQHQGRVRGGRRPRHRFLSPLEILCLPPAPPFHRPSGDAGQELISPGDVGLCLKRGVWDVAGAHPGGRLSGGGEGGAAPSPI